ncbi:MAG: hypothetical protein ACYDAP_03110 [Thermoplasmataceae archaeon]
MPETNIPLIMMIDLNPFKAYSMKENIRNLWSSPSMEEGKKYLENWYS